MLSEHIARLRSLWYGVRHRSTVEAEMTEEFRLHVELRARDLERSGLSSTDALLQARREFGAAERYKEEGRESRGLHRVDAIRFSWLDVKLGVRMMIRYPGLTVIAGLGIAVAIAIATGYTSAMQVLLNGSLPLPEGDRVVALQNWDTRGHHRAPTTFADFVSWREGLRSVRDVGAYRTITRNLVGADGTAEPLTIAELSASGFRVARVPPLLGRPLLPSDEEEDAPPVVVIAHDVWTRRYAADAGIIGRDLRLGARIHTIVGVMPDGFAFPINHHFWIPLRADPATFDRGGGSDVNVFGRLAPGATLAQARTEVDVIGRRAASAFPETYASLRAQAHLYTRPVVGMDNPQDVQGALMVPLLTTLLLILICVNAAILIYARTAIRHGEIVVRTALGASRRRVITQLFAESLALALVAAVVGLSIAGFALHRADLLLASLFGGQLPFWLDFNLSFGSVLYAGGLALLAAVITGVLPALRATGAQVQSSLQQLSAGSGSMRLGGAWTALIISQVAIVVALLPMAVFQAGEMYRYGTVDVGFAAEEFVSSTVEMEATDESSFGARYAVRLDELVRRLRAEPGVSNAAFASSIPGKERHVQVEVEGSSTGRSRDDSASSSFRRGSARLALVEPSFFRLFDVAVLSGRAFTTADADTNVTVVIVNRSFVTRYLADGEALGRRVRQVASRVSDHSQEDVQPGRWYQIVGVVPDFPNPMIPQQVEAKIYQAAAPTRMNPLMLSVRLRRTIDANVGARMRQVAATLDPSLQLRSIRALDDIYEGDQSAIRMAGIAIAIVTLSVVLLSSAGIYAMMSVAVTRRRRELALRAALGANARQLLASVFVRTTSQLGIGIVAGLATALLVDQLALGGVFTRSPVLLSVVSAIVLTVGLLASIGPARRGLRIQPAEALKQE